MAQYVQQLTQLLAGAPGPRIERFKIRQFLTDPLRNPNLLSQLGAPQSVHLQIRQPEIQKLVASILSIWVSLASGNAHAAFSACIASLGIVGGLMKQDNGAVVPDSILVALLQGLSTIARKIGPNGSAQSLLDALRLEYAHLRRDAKADMQKQVGMVTCLIEIIKICVVDRAANPSIVDSLLASTQGILSTDELGFPKSVSTTFYFYVAKHMLFLDDFDNAREQLEKALAQCLPSRASVMGRNRRRILYFLIPLRMTQGIFPTKQLLREFPDLDELYSPIVKAVRSKNFAEFSRVLAENDSLSTNFFTLWKRVENVIHRGILRQLWLQSGNIRRVDFSLFARVLGETNEGLVEEILGNLLREGLITGYISYEERAVMLTGANPFPAPPWTTHGGFL